MKTSILISGIAAFLLMITFAEAPLSRVTNGLSKLQNDEISFFQVNGIMPLAETNIPTLKKETSTVTTSANPVEDYSYLKFDVSYYMAADATMEAYDLLPEFPVNDYSYLKFEVNEYMGNSEYNDTETIELPEQSLNEFTYLRFDVTDYYTTGEIETVEIPVIETETNYTSSTLVSGEEENKFSYLKFDVNNFYNTKKTGSEYELPK